MSKLLELVLTATYDNQEIINRFNYLASGTPGEDNAAAALVQAFGCIWDGTEYPTGLPFNDILLLQNPNVVYSFASARDVYDPLDFEEVPFVNPAIGKDTGSGSAESPFLAFGLRTNRTRLDIRRGTKRFVGVGESSAGAYGALVSGAVSNLNTVAAALTSVLTQTLDANSFTFAPCIAGKQRYNPSTGLPDPDGTAYRYYPVEADQLAKLATGITWEVYTDVRTQNSRKIGKGR